MFRVDISVWLLPITTTATTSSIVFFVLRCNWHDHLINIQESTGGTLTFSESTATHLYAPAIPSLTHNCSNIGSLCLTDPQREFDRI